MKRAHVHEYGPIFINIETFRRCLICGFAVPITVVPPELRLNQDSRARAGAEAEAICDGEEVRGAGVADDPAHGGTQP